MNGDTVQINELLFFGIIILLLFLVGFYLENKESAEQIKNLKEKISTIEEQKINLEIELNKTIIELNECRSSYNELKEETSVLIAKYLAQEAFWDIIGAKELELICGIVKIQFRDSIPEVKNLPC